VVRGQAGRHQRRPGPRDAAVGERARLVQPEQRRVRRLAGGRVLARGLAERRRRALDVEDVVDDLEQQPQLPGEVAQRPVDLGRRTGTFSVVSLRSRCLRD